NFQVANGADSTIFDEPQLTGEPVSVDPRTLYCFGEEFRPDRFEFGHALLLGIPGPMPPYFVSPTPSPTPSPAPYVTINDQAERARRQGGLVSFAHPLYNFPFSGVTTSWELPVVAALGNLDSVDILHLSTDEDASSLIWYKLLNTGLYLAATAATD